MDAETTTWFFRTVAVLLIAIITYFLKQAADTLSKCVEKLNDHETRITVIERDVERLELHNIVTKGATT